MKNENIVYGRLAEAVHISGYSLERAIGEFEWLLEEERWKKVGDGFDDIDDFTNTLNFKEFNIAIEQRQKIVKKLSVIKASQRSIANMLGVGKSTINRDLKDNVPNGTKKEKIDVDNQGDIKNNVPNGTPDHDTWMESAPDHPKKERQKEEKQKKKEEEKKQQAEEGFKKEIDIDFRLGDFESVFSNIPDNSVDCIITDPPYSEKHIECWSKLSRFAKRVLKPNGFCITYSGQMNLPEVIKRMSENLVYYWTFSLLHTGNRQLINGRGLFCGWKPILIFQKGFKKNDQAFDDFIIGSGYEKEQHEWQQGEYELHHIIENFTKPGDLIIEPFAGGGTTIIAAINLKRNIKAAEIDKQSYNIAKRRIWKNSDNTSIQS